MVRVIVSLSLLFTTGCWDRRELNDRAIWLATGWDLGNDSDIQLSGQIVISNNKDSQGSQGGGGGGGNSSSMGPGYFTVSENGNNLGDIMQKIQAELSREVFFGQRRMMFIGEEFAKRGLRNELDADVRSANVSLRTDLLIVKGGTAFEGLQPTKSIETPPARAALKKHERVGGRGDTAYLEFLISANKDGIVPTVAAIELVKSKQDPASQVLRIAGVAIFNKDLKLLGYMNMDEDRDLLWIMGKLNQRIVSVASEDGNASLIVTDLKNKITPKFSNTGQIGFIVKLTGEGELFENNTQLNADKRHDLTLLQKKFEDVVKKQVLQTIHKAQKEFGVDIFGFGEVIHRKHPIKWKELKQDWHPHFSEADVVVEIDLPIKRIGLSGPSLLQTESENHK